jgi:hypothetical protein
MAKIEGPLMSIEAHGSIGSRLTFSSRKSGQQVRFQNKQVDTKSAAQINRRKAFFIAKNLWFKISDAQRAKYNNYTIKHRLNITGYNLFIQRSMNLSEILKDAVCYLSCDTVLDNITPDLTIKGNNGTVEGATLTTGKFDNGFSFDGINNKIIANGVISDLDLSKTSNISLCGWFNRTAATGLSFQGLSLIGTWTDYLFIGFTDTSIIAQMRGGNGTYPKVTDDTDYSGLWTHICIVKTGEELRLFVNGILKGTDDTTGLSTDIGVNKFILGWGYSDLYAYDGLIDEIMLLQTALNQSEIQRIMSLTTPLLLS